MEMVNLNPFIIIGGILISCVFYLIFRLLKWRKEKKHRLKKYLDEYLEKVRENNELIEEYDYQYRIVIRDLKYLPENWIEEIERLSTPIRGKARKAIDFLTPRYRGKFWKLYANHIWLPEKIPSRFIKPPRLNIRHLKKWVFDLIGLFLAQRKLLKAYSPLDKTIRFRGKMISTIEWTDLMRIGKDKKAEREEDDERAKIRAEEAITQLRLTVDQFLSLSSDPEKVTKGANYLSLEATNDLCTSVLAKLDSLEEENMAPKELVELCSSIAVDFEENFGKWAEEIHKRQKNFERARSDIAALEEKYGTKISATNELNHEILRLFQEVIPLSWETANWSELEQDLQELDIYLTKLNALLKDLDDFTGTITNLELRFQEIQKMEKVYEETYGLKDNNPSGDWRAALESWNQVLNLWATGKHDRLEAVLANFDQPLKNQDFKIRNLLDIACQATGTNWRKLPVFEKPRKSYLPGKDNDKPKEEDAPRRSIELSGNSVTIESYGGLIVEVDSSQADGWTGAKKKGKHTK